MLSYAIVRDALISKGFSSFREAGKEHAVSAARYLTRRAESLPANVVVLVDEQGIAALEGLSRPALNPLVCLERDVAERANSAAPAADILIVPEGMDAPTVLDELWCILHEYESWIQDMLLCALSSNSIRQFLAIASAKLANPIAVLDSDFRILARSEIAEPLPAGTIWDRMMGESFDMATYYDARERALITRAFENDANREIVFHPNRDSTHKYYSASLQVDGKLVGCIGIVDVFAPLNGAQVAIARIVRDMLESYLRKNQRSLLLEDASRGFWFDLITGRPIDARRIEGKLTDVGWRIDDTYIMVSFVSASERNSSVEMTSVLHLITVEFPFAKIAVDGHILTTLMHFSDFKRTASPSAEPFSHYGGLRAGVSFPFSQMSYREAAYRQSVYSVEYARAHDLEHVEYPTVQAQHLSETLKQASLERGVPIETYCNPHLIQLAASPRESDRALITCLRAYLLNGRNIAETSRALFLHRNTVIYRIKKLSAILELDFAELTEPELFSLIVSCSLVEEAVTEV